MPGPELVGSWTLTRTVTDVLAGRSGSVAGELLVAVDGDRIGWYETGLLRWAGRTSPVSRTSYLVEIGGEAWMTFADGRPFHPWLPGTDVEHRCGDDLYRGRVEVDGDAMSMVWRVTGPAKDQLLSTGLRRR